MRRVGLPLWGPLGHMVLLLPLLAPVLLIYPWWRGIGHQNYVELYSSCIGSSRIWWWGSFPALHNYVGVSLHVFVSGDYTLFTLGIVLL